MVRPATTADAEAIARVHVRTWQHAYGHVFPRQVLDALSVDERKEQWRSWISRGERPVFVAEVHDAVRGFAAVGPSEEDPGRGELYAIYVEPEEWGSGLAQALLERSEGELRNRGHAEAVLLVLHDHPRARRFYERNGWIAGEPFRETIRGRDVDVVWFRKDLGE